MAYPRFQRARSHKFLTRTAGNLAITSAAWVDLTTAMDMTLNAQVGDVLEYGINGLWNNEAVTGQLTVATVVGGTSTNMFLAGTTSADDGASGWAAYVVSQYYPLSGSILYTVQTADIASGLVTVRLRGKGGSSSTKTVLANANDPLHVFVKNLGPVDPN